MWGSYDIRDIVLTCGADSERWHERMPDMKLDAITYHVLGVAGEGGEVANEFKKLGRGGKWDNEEGWRKFLEEQADTLTHLCALAYLLNYDPGEGYWSKREFNERRFGEGSDNQSGVTTAVRKQQQGPFGPTAFVPERDVQITVQPETRG